MSLWNRAPKSDRLFFIASVALLVFSITMVGVQDRRIHAATEDEEFYRFVDVAAEVYSEIKTKFVDEVESRYVLEGALSGMFSALDEHSQYMTPDMLKSLERDTSGEFSGIGIHLTKRQGLLTVIAPIPGSPAAKAGIIPWDRIIEIEGKTTQEMDITEAVKMLTGPSGTQVSFKVYRAGTKEPMDFTLIRASVEVKSVYGKMLDNKIGYIRMTRFSENTSRDVRKFILEFKAEGMEGLILDQRLNTGGLLTEAIEVSNLFVNKGELIVSTKGRLRNQNKEYRATNDPIVSPDLPVFVLVNESSASASEIVAGCLQDLGLAVIIGPSGKNTFGKGSVQTIGQLVHTMTDDENGNEMNSALRLTTARYYTPSGRTIHHIGITPDISVPLTEKHEIELIRHGLFGDINTGEDYRLPDEEETKEGEDATDKEPANDEVPAATPTPEPTPAADPNKPFYEVEIPELPKTDDFVDIMLEEAQKQMKIYMILKTKTKNQVADRIGTEKLSLILGE